MKYGNEITTKDVRKAIESFPKYQDEPHCELDLEIRFKNRYFKTSRGDFFLTVDTDCYYPKLIVTTQNSKYEDDWTEVIYKRLDDLNSADWKKISDLLWNKRKRAQGYNRTKFSMGYMKKINGKYEFFGDGFNEI